MEKCSETSDHDHLKWTKAIASIQSTWILLSLYLNRLTPYSNLHFNFIGNKHVTETSTSTGNMGVTEDREVMAASLDEVVETKSRKVSIPHVDSTFQHSDTGGFGQAALLAVGFYKTLPGQWRPGA